VKPDTDPGNQYRVTVIMMQIVLSANTAHERTRMAKTMDKYEKYEKSFDDSKCAETQSGQ